MQPPLNKKWQIAPPISPEADQALRGFSPVFRQVLYTRGYTDEASARTYLEARMPEGTDPQGLLGMDAAVDRIRRALARGEQIAIYGDYDADGVTSTALLTLVLRSLNASVRGYIPNRFEEGYGLNTDALDGLKKEGVSLVITVDCGARSLPEAAHARKIGLDLIITDHHSPTAELPDCLALINPKQPGDTYPDKNLAGVGLAYKLACALLAADNETSSNGRPLPEDFLDLVALGTVADLAPLTGENRALVRLGLGYLRRPMRQGILSLIGVCDLKPEQISAEHIGFGLGPRLNAAGRLELALAALDLLVCSDPASAGPLAQELNRQNYERQQLTRKIQELAEKQALTDDPEGLLLFAAHSDYNSGVIGLAASRLTEHYYRPAIVAALGDEFTRGSCRSIPEFHITNALDECADLLIRHGGHAAAAGFTVRTQDLPELVERLRVIARRELSERDLQPILTADGEAPLGDMDRDLWLEMLELEPTGSGNPGAAFVSRGLRVLSSKVVGKDGSHLKLRVTDGMSIPKDAIAFRQGQWAGKLPTYVDLIYKFEMNLYNGYYTPQLNVKDIRPAGEPG